MPIDTRDVDAQQMLTRWEMCRDFANGSHAVKEKKTRYLPALEGATDERSYQSYLNRALFYPATGRTVLGLMGLLFGKPISIVGAQKSWQDLFKDVTKSGQNLGSFGVTIAEEVLKVGRVGILVDAPPDGAVNSPAYLTRYQAESILSVRTTRRRGVDTLTRVILEEEIEEADPNDPFILKCSKQLRALFLDPRGIYTVQLYRKDANSKWIPHGLPVQPRRRGELLEFIPFTFCNVSNIESGIQKPPLEDLVVVNLSHYLTSADREHGAHFTALPTPYVTGHKNTSDQFTIGAGVAWVFPNDTAKVGMLEFSGSGLGALRDLMNEKREMMQSLGARLLEAQKNVQEATATVRMRNSAEGSVIALIAGSIGEALSKAARTLVWWAGLEGSESMSVRVNTDNLERLTPQEISALVASWQSGAISHETLYYNLQRGEITRPDITFEEEKSEIDEELADKPEDPGIEDGGAE